MWCMGRGGWGEVKDYCSIESTVIITVKERHQTDMHLSIQHKISPSKKDGRQEENLQLGSAIYTPLVKARFNMR